MAAKTKARAKAPVRATARMASPSRARAKTAPARVAPRITGATVEGYLAAVPPTARAALQDLRRLIQAAAPRATEVISYGIPAFKHDGMLVGYGASGGQCALYLMSTRAMEAHAAELGGYDLGKGTIRYSPDRPLPPALVRKLVRARVAENEARR